MPIYEYRCNDCRKRVTVYWRSFSEVESARPHCPACGGANLARLISRVAVLRSEESRMEGLADPSNLAGLDENDPKGMARWMRKMSREMGEDLGPEFDEAIDRLEAGESPEEVEAAMPELGGSGGLGGYDEM